MKTYCQNRRRGHTLLEAMVATVLFSMVTLGFVVTLLESYKMGTMVKHRNEAQAALRSVADQFLNPTLSQEAADSRPQVETFFDVTPPPPGADANWLGTGTGMTWRTATEVFSFIPQVGDPDWADYDPASYGMGDDTGLVVMLGRQSSSPIRTTLFRKVTALTPKSGDGSGQLLRGDFTAIFNVGGKEYKQTLSVVRCFP